MVNLVVICMLVQLVKMSNAIKFALNMMPDADFMERKLFLLWKIMLLRVDRQVLLCAVDLTLMQTSFGKTWVMR